MVFALAVLRFGLVAETVLATGSSPVFGLLVLVTLAFAILGRTTLGLGVGTLDFSVGARFFATGRADFDFSRVVGRLAAGLRAGMAFFLFVPGSARFMRDVG